MNGTFHTCTSPFTHTWGQFRVSSQPNVPVFGPEETQHGLHLRRSGLELDPEPCVGLCTRAEQFLPGSESEHYCWSLKPVPHKGTGLSDHNYISTSSVYE